MQRNFAQGLSVVTNTIAEDLRKKGSVEIHENFLLWSQIGITQKGADPGFSSPVFL
jgi:hypothetical protein